MRITRTSTKTKSEGYPTFVVYTDEYSGSTLMFVFREYKDDRDREDDWYTGVDECANVVKWENEKFLIDDPNVQFLPSDTKLEITI